ncbi:MAG TPA: transglutaminase family protein [Anaeromyxobacteraceae bacterium]|nr:transglutaminase family protein [Anaeromyxobacteraceae bacterium]
MRELLADCRAQDEALRRARLEIWLGAEPTFTDRSSQEAHWLWQAEGGNKEERAESLLRALVARLASSASLVRAEGRKFPGEERARFCLGARYQPGRAGEAPRALETSGLRGVPVGVPELCNDERWLTVTPDPGVVEVNLAPAPDLLSFAHHAEAVYAAAEEAGLSAVRYRWNGHATDSGGGGQITLGGPSPERSPFFLSPQLLPSLVRYLNHHPSLSYAFAPDCVGSAGQGPRPDEGVRELFEELGVALDRLAARSQPGPEELWSSLAPLLVDASGNSHRAELNVEKLWNPHLPGRGRMGVVELRALRMPQTALRLVALGALFRAVAARLAREAYDEPLVDWGPELHDRASLPFYLEQDLRGVLEDLEEQGYGLGPRVQSILLAPPPEIARVELAGATLAIRPAVDFWPLVGDVASQERSSARIVDASSERLELAVTSPGQTPGHIAAQGVEVPLEPGGGATHLAAVRYRAFAPHPGLHPGLGPHDPLVLEWERRGEALRIELHGWKPGGGAYPGLPADAAEAERRRRERVVVRPGRPRPARRAPSGRLTLDLRRLTTALPT